jgi:acetyl esterase/lipase
MHLSIGAIFRALGFCSAGILLAGCQSKTETYQGERPTAAPTKQQMEQMERQTAKALAPADSQMKAVLNELKALKPKPIETLSADNAREQPTPADAVKRLLKKQNRSTDPEPVADVDNRKIEVRDQKIPVRVYTPKGNGPFPVIVYFTVEAG